MALICAVFWVSIPQPWATCSQAMVWEDMAGLLQATPRLSTIAEMLSSVPREEDSAESDSG